MDSRMAEVPQQVTVLLKGLVISVPLTLYDFTHLDLDARIVSMYIFVFVVLLYPFSFTLLKFQQCRKRGGMKRFKNHLIAAAVLSVLATVGTIMNSHQA